MSQMLQGKGEVYMITCIPSGKKYIGQTRCFKGKRVWGTEKRWQAHISNALHGKIKRCTALCNAILKYGVNAFSVKTILICDENKLNYYETKYIRQYGTMAPSGYNLRFGGSAGSWSLESRERLAAAKKGEKNCRYGVKLSDEVKQRIREGNTGKVRTIQMNQRMSEIKKNQKPENIGLPRYIYHHRSENIEGYKIMNHPLLKPKVKVFGSTTQTMSEKFEAAMKFLDQIKIIQ